MLSKKTIYGLKALSYLAKKDPGKPVLISEISENEKISKKFLETILLDLKKLGFVNSKQGKGGGYYLAKNPNQITLTSLIRGLEGPIAWIPCVSLNYYEKCDDCTEDKVCNLHETMSQIRDATLNILDNTTLYDLIDKRK